VRDLHPSARAGRKEKLFPNFELPSSGGMRDLYGTIFSIHIFKYTRSRHKKLHSPELLRERIHVRAPARYIVHDRYISHTQKHSWFNNRENDDAYYMFRSYNNCYYSSSEAVTDEEDEL